ncbi:MAG: hypothetical protein B7Y66_10155, partial [Sphingobacteriia bacterium 35-36-14]
KEIGPSPVQIKKSYKPIKKVASSQLLIKEQFNIKEAFKNKRGLNKINGVFRERNGVFDGIF